MDDELKDALEMLGAKDQPAAIIDPPRTVKQVTDSGLAEYEVWGWVKISAKFINHIKILRGAKLAIWQTIALAINKDGECKLTIKQLCELTGYERGAVMTAIQELDELGYLSVSKSGTGRIYKPEFSARGDLQPSEGRKMLPLKNGEKPTEKVHSTPPNRSTPAEEKNVSSIKSIKELREAVIKSNPEFAILAGATNEEISEASKEWQARDASRVEFETALGFSNPLRWDADRDWERFAEWVQARYTEDAQIFRRYQTWRNTPFVKGAMDNRRIRGFVNEFYDSWDMFKMSDFPADTGYVREKRAL